MLLDRSQIKLNEEIFRKEIGINFDWHEIDDLIISDSNILRPVKGYALQIPNTISFSAVVNVCLRVKFYDKLFIHTRLFDYIWRFLICIKLRRG